LPKSVIVGIIERPVLVEETRLHVILQGLGVKERDLGFLGE
jgi:hypothetical protein